MYGLAIENQFLDVSESELSTLKWRRSDATKLTMLSSISLGRVGATTEASWRGNLALVRRRLGIAKGCVVVVQVQVINEWPCQPSFEIAETGARGSGRAEDLCLHLATT